MGQREIVLWGSGTPKREFLYSEDLADACIFLMNRDRETFDSLIGSETTPPLINVGTGNDQTILETAALIAEIVGVDASLRFDSTKPDGTPRKVLDVSRLGALGWHSRTTLRNGLKAAYRDFLQQESRNIPVLT